MTLFRIPIKDILGLSYYRYELTSSNYTPTSTSTITITCTCTNVFGNPVKDKELTLYENGSMKGTSTTDDDGIASWNITLTENGLRSFKVGNNILSVWVDNKSNLGHTHTKSQITNFAHNHNTWDSINVTNGTLYYNSAIKMCELRYARTFNSGQQNVMYEWGTLIPSTYRPKHLISGTGNRNASTMAIDTDGKAYGRFGIAFSSETNFYFHLVWHY